LFCTSPIYSNALIATFKLTSSLPTITTFDTLRAKKNFLPYPYFKLFQAEAKSRKQSHNLLNIFF